MPQSGLVSPVPEYRLMHWDEIALANAEKKALILHKPFSAIWTYWQLHGPSYQVSMFAFPKKANKNPRLAWSREF